jgi:hypothetical protein
VEKNLGFRGWFYFRTGWATYFAFVVAAINTLTVTFFLAIEKYPVLNVIFPSFFHYIVIVVGIGVPILVIVGYVRQFLPQLQYNEKKREKLHLVPDIFQLQEKM